MIRSLHIQGYRCFENFEMSGLGRVNLLVGTNNSGKTSILEAIHLLVSRGDSDALARLLLRRGELSSAKPHGYGDIPYDVYHLFRGHEPRPGSSFSISSPEGSITFSIKQANPRGDGWPTLALVLDGTPEPIVGSFPVTPDGSLSITPLPRRVREQGTKPPAAVFVTTDSVAVEELLALWDRVALTSAEDVVVKALRFIDPGVERIAAQTTARPAGLQLRGGFIVKMRGLDQPIPIGSLGDGMWRMIALAIAITQCRGGALLVDEIDTGLHYTVMASMWQMIFNAAKEFDVQVFATTHSADCIDSLAPLCAHADAENPITVQRIESGKSKAIAYGEEEIQVASVREIEVR